VRKPVHKIFESKRVFSTKECIKTVLVEIESICFLLLKAEMQAVVSGKNQGNTTKNNSAVSL
jgi:hypothetical protein